MKFLLIRPPRYLWYIVNESDNYLIPLGLPCISAAVRKWLPEVEVKIIDCPPLKIGWNSLEKILREEKPDIVGAGEEALYHHEAVRAFDLAKKINPHTITIGGGHFFSWTPEESLKNYPIDIIVRFEGEITIVETLKALLNRSDLKKVDGISFKKDGIITHNPLRDVVEDLDDLPMPAYDMLPIKSYATKGYLWPNSATMEHSRGCSGDCKFCSIWTFWGKNDLVKNDSGKAMPRKQIYRSKSPERSLQELDWLYKTFNRKYIVWGDATWNADPKWTNEFCEGLLKRNYKDLHWWAFLRADCIVRDEKLGILEKMVKCGLVHPLIGIERCEDSDLDLVRKHSLSDTTREAFKIFKTKYPHVFRQGTFITCLRHDTKESMLKLVDHAIELEVDYPAFHVFSPVPGTLMREEAEKNNWIEITDYKQYDWFTPIISSETLSREELTKTNLELNKRYVLYRPLWAVKGLFSKSKHIRTIYWWWFSMTVRMMFNALKEAALGKTKFKGYDSLIKLIKPKWYDN